MLGGYREPAKIAARNPAYVMQMAANELRAHGHPAEARDVSERLVT
jgi:hypothetical protein